MKTYIDLETEFNETTQIPHYEFKHFLYDKLKIKDLELKSHIEYAKTLIKESQNITITHRFPEFLQIQKI